MFTEISKADYPSFLGSILEEEHPTWLSDYGSESLLVGWLHPLYRFEKTEGRISIRYNQDRSRYEGLFHHNLEETEFLVLRDKIKAHLDRLSLPYLTSETAILIAAASGDHLLPETNLIEFDSPQLFHNFEDIPSPIYLNERRLTFVRMWKIPVQPQEARGILSANPIDLADEVQTCWNVKRGPKTKETFLMSSLVFSCPGDASCNDFFNSIEKKRDELLEEIARHIQTMWQGAELSTVEFWRTEVGFKIEADKFEGSPWVMFLGEKKPEDKAPITYP